MKLKSYFSGTVEAALELARKELGEEALLVNARPATPETRSLGAFEVVFGVPDQLAPTPSTPTTDVEQLRRDLGVLKGEMDRMLQSLRDVRAFPAAKDDTDGPFAELTESGLQPALARQVANGTLLEDLFETDATLGKAGAGRAVVALVGPPGAGKTSSLVKLAARYGLTGKKPAHILSIDVHRIAASAQLRTLAAILGIGFDVVETPVALAQALEEHKGKGVILVDTPGLGPRDLDDFADLAGYLAGHPEIDTHLVLPAFADAQDLARMSDRFQCFRPGKLLFTRLDETERYGACIGEAARAGIPISFLSNGQRIPDDLEPAAKALLIGLVSGKERRLSAETNGDIHKMAPLSTKRIGAAA